ncbi:MAG: 3-deoxy-D-manno-octulosonic acid transferase [Gammaproteobacteria bacterium WSBS_2016_MAG_OTU1]
MSPIRLLYTLALYAALPCILPYLAYKKRLNRQCFGFVPRPPAGNTPLIWLHAVSVGEASAAAGLIEHLRAQNYRLVLTHTTAAGGIWLRRQHGEYAHIYQLPLDLPGAIQRFMQRVQPTMVIIMEAEYWPNMLSSIKNSSAVVLLANARLSANSARKYAKCVPLMREMLSAFNAAAAQTRADQQRLQFFGLQKTVIAGNLKFDRRPNQQQITQGKTWRQTWQIANTKPILLIAGSRPGEEKLLLSAMDDTLWETFFVIFAPRHIERGDTVADLLTTHNINFGRRSIGDEPAPHETSAYLADTLGEMDTFYSCSDVAIICGSFLPFGGQNPMEAMLSDVAAIIGPHVANYRAFVAKACRQGALCQAADAAAALQKAQALIAATADKQQQQQAATTLCQRHQGALTTHTDLAMKLLSTK